MNRNGKIAILGASGHGKVVADAALLAGWCQVVFFDDAWPKVSSIGKWNVIGDSIRLIDHATEYDGIFVAIGDNRIRLEKIKMFEQSGLKPVTIIHPSAIISPYSLIGTGSVLCAGSVINPFVEVGNGCIINTGATVDHDCKLADGVHISPGAHLGGGVVVGTASWIGLGACVKQCIRIGDGSTVGMGAAVISDVRSGATVVGVPAREIRT